MLKNILLICPRPDNEDAWHARNIACILRVTLTTRDRGSCFIVVVVLVSISFLYANSMRKCWHHPRCSFDRFLAVRNWIYAFKMMLLLIVMEWNDSRINLIYESEYVPYISKDFPNVIFNILYRWIANLTFGPFNLRKLIWLFPSAQLSNTV